MKHTPGPWKIMMESNDAIIRYSDGELVSYVARIYDGTLCPEHGTVEANAHLIASAPEMLGALKRLLRQYEIVAPEYFNVEAAVNAKQAIAKAEGRE